jgi:hypothetical protein
MLHVRCGLLRCCACSTLSLSLSLSSLLVYRTLVVVTRLICFLQRVPCNAPVGHGPLVLTNRPSPATPSNTLVLTLNPVFSTPTLTLALARSRSLSLSLACSFALPTLSYFDQYLCCKHALKLTHL